MTTPDMTPSKAKTWGALVGAILTALVPYILSVSTALPEPWPAVVGAVIAVLTALGVYKAPYVPPGAVVAPATPAVIAAANETTPAYSPSSGTWTNPWK